MNFIVKFDRDLNEAEQALVDEVMRQVTAQAKDEIDARRWAEGPIAQVEAEVERQGAIWGRQDHPDAVWHLILSEEVGEAAKAVLEACDVETEVIQCAAVAVSWLESRRLRREREDS